jgi:hypothetical protein
MQDDGQQELWSVSTLPIAVSCQRETIGTVTLLPLGCQTEHGKGRHSSSFSTALVISSVEWSSRRE